METYLNTILLLVVIGILIIAMRRNRKGVDILRQDSHINKKSQKIEINSAQGTVPSVPIPDVGAGLAPELENAAILQDLFELEEISPTEVIVMEKELGITEEASYLQVFGELVKSSGHVKQASAAFKICFKPDVERGLRTGVFKLMSRLNGNKQLTAVDAAGGNRVVGNGWIEVAKADRLIALSSLAWQGMALITAQKFLSDINRTMKEVKAAIDDIKHLHEAEIEGKLIGWQRYIQQAAERLAGNINETERQAIAVQLEEIHRLSIQEYFASEDRLKRKIDVLCDVMRDKNADNDTAESVEGKCLDVEKEASRLLGFAKINVANMIAMNMRLDFRPDIGLGDSHRLLKDSLCEVAQGIDKSLRLASKLTTGIFSFESTAKEVRKSLKKKIGTLSSRIHEQQVAQIKLISSIRERLGQSQSLYYRIDKHGHVAQAELVHKRSKGNKH